MAASSGSAVCLEATEVLGWFPEQAQKKQLLQKFVKARRATEQHPDAWAQKSWEAVCTDMRAVMQDSVMAEEAFEIVCDFLEQHIKGLEEKPGNHQPGGGAQRQAKRQRSLDQPPQLGHPKPGNGTRPQSVSGLFIRVRVKQNSSYRVI